jgi:hypothetical protein
MESCYAKTAMAGVGGFALGGLFGMFMASVRLFFCLRSESRPQSVAVRRRTCT